LNLLFENLSMRSGMCNGRARGIPTKGGHPKWLISYAGSFKCPIAEKLR
jgi:hypothetical protein